MRNEEKTDAIQTLWKDGDGNVGTFSELLTIWLKEIVGEDTSKLET